MLLSTIQKDLFSFIEHDPEDVSDLVEFWYRANSAAVSAALAAQPGLSLIVNVSSFSKFEELANKAFLVADTLIVRDTRDWMEEGEKGRALLVPSGEYTPGYYDKVLDQLSGLRPPALTLQYRPNFVMSATQKRLNNGIDFNYVVDFNDSGYKGIPQQFIDWIAESGKAYMETGRIVYAPFIPSFEMELEFLKHQVNVPGYFNATPLYSQKFDWLSGSKIDALLSINIPYLEGLDVATLTKIKEDNRPEFESFSRSMLNSITGVKGAVGSEDFVKDLRYIQRNLIDAGVADIEKTIRRVSTMNSLRKLGIGVGLLGLDAAILFGIPASAIASGMAAAGVAMVAHFAAQIKEQGDLKDKSPYFLWKLRQLKR
jgi:hypothetical protein